MARALNAAATKSTSAQSVHEKFLPGRADLTVDCGRKETWRITRIVCLFYLRHKSFDTTLNDIAPIFAPLWQLRAKVTHSWDLLLIFLEVPLLQDVLAWTIIVHPQLSYHTERNLETKP